MAGAYETGVYPNCFIQAGLDQQAVDEKIRAAFDTIFFDPAEKFYHDVDGDSGCLEDTGNRDARTEGMSYGMMMCVQMDRRDLFDKLWNFSRRYMLLTDGPPTPGISPGLCSWTESTTPKAPPPTGRNTSPWPSFLPKAGGAAIMGIRPGKSCATACTKRN